MADKSFLDWPFFEERHRELSEALEHWAVRRLSSIDHADTDAACRDLVARLGQGGWLEHAPPRTASSTCAACA